MKEFDLEKAKAGAPVCTREGRKVRIVCFDVKGDKYPILALAENPNGVDEDIMWYTRDGKYYDPELDFGQSVDDLMMADVTHGGWVLIDPEVKHCFSFVFDTQEEAEAKASTATIAHVVVAHIEWEE